MHSGSWCEISGIELCQFCTFFSAIRNVFLSRTQHSVIWRRCWFHVDFSNYPSCRLETSTPLLGRSYQSAISPKSRLTCTKTNALEMKERKKYCLGQTGHLEDLIGISIIFLAVIVFLKVSRTKWCFPDRLSFSSWKSQSYRSAVIIEQQQEATARD